jgi:hypothetical protein
MAATIYVVEQSSSRSYNYDTGRVNASRVFKVYASDGAGGAFGGTLDDVADVKALFGTGTTPDALPQKGDLFPGESTIYAKAYAISREPNTDIWTVTWTYGNNQVTTGAQPGEVGYVEWTLDVAATFVDTWIESPAYPNLGGIGSTPSAALITGGNQIDIEGAPVSRLKYTSEITISETISNYSGVPSIVSAMRGARGKRNSGDWEGFGGGKVLYTGGSIRRTGLSTFVANHRLIEDSEYHLIQYPARDSTGKIPTKVVNGANRAREVYWRQPFPDTMDFTTISANW